MSVDFSSIPELPLDEAYRLTALFKADNHPKKVLLGAGVYKDENMKPWVLPSVKEAKRILHFRDLDHEYLPIQGNDAYLSLARDLALGTSPSSPQQPSSSPTVVSVQTISGTGANHLGALFLAEQLKPRNVWISDPTWANHHLIWTVAAPQVTQKLYPYYDARTGGLDFAGMVTALESAERGDVVLLHACAHNPTGIDLTREQWKLVAEVCGRRGLFVFFDNAYQGFASGDVEVDGWVVRYFLETLVEGQSGLSICVAQSFAKSFGLYGERAGAFHLVMPQGTKGEGAKSRLLRLIRSEISTCPLYGARIVETVLSDERLREMWHADLRTMAERIRGVRRRLREELERLPGSGDWAHLESQIGMFSYTGLNKGQVKRLAEKHHVYLMESGRASLSGVNDGNVEYVAKCFNEVLTCGKL